VQYMNKYLNQRGKHLRSSIEEEGQDWTYLGAASFGVGLGTGGLLALGGAASRV